MRYYLAIDIGASSGRHILGWLDGGKMQTEEIYRFQNSPMRCENPDGSINLLWDTERLFSEIVAGLRRAGELGKIPEVGDTFTFEDLDITVTETEFQRVLFINVTCNKQLSADAEAEAEEAEAEPV